LSLAMMARLKEQESREARSQLGREARGAPARGGGPAGGRGPARAAATPSDAAAPPPSKSGGFSFFGRKRTGSTKGDAPATGNAAGSSKGAPFADEAEEKVVANVTMTTRL
jgi:hypothetical protein